MSWRAPRVVLSNERLGDRDVRVTVPDVERWCVQTPVFVDDIASTCRTLIEIVRHLVAARMRAPVCVCLHALFAQSAYSDLLFAGAARMATTNSVPHPSNDIDVSALVAAGVRRVTMAKNLTGTDA